MCGRFVGYRKLEELREFFPIERANCDVTPNFNIAPAQEVLAISSNQGENSLDKFHGPGLCTMCPFPSPLGVREKYIGLPIADTRVRVVDPVTQKELPDGEVGELTLQDWHVMKGYWKNPEETRKQIIDGWLHMGDLASKEKNGYLKIYGRTKDLINRGGYKIYPYELESLLVDHPKVEQVCVVATPNPVLGVSIRACVIPRAKEKMSLKEIRDFLKDRIALHKLPDELCIMSDFPRLSGGMKLKKFGTGGLIELANKNENRERIRK